MKVLGVSWALNLSSQESANYVARFSAEQSKLTFKIVVPYVSFLISQHSFCYGQLLSLRPGGLIALPAGMGLVLCVSVKMPYSGSLDKGEDQLGQAI